MAYRILYIDDNATASRAKDLENLGYRVDSYNPSSDLSKLLSEIKEDTNALVLDYRLTNGENNACFDAPTIAQMFRTKHFQDKKDIPIILMSNEDVIVDYYKNFTSQDLFDFVLTKEDFIADNDGFKDKLNSFLFAYEKIKECGFDICKILEVDPEEAGLVHNRLLITLEQYRDDVFKYSNFLYKNLLESPGTLIGEDILSARLGISKDSLDWSQLLDNLGGCKYSGIFSDIYDRWWMEKVNIWWKEEVGFDEPLRRLNAEERVAIIKEQFSLENLQPAVKTKFSQSTNFWTICKHSKKPLDPFDGIELIGKEYNPWQEKEYISFDSALEKIDDYKDEISKIDRKEVRKLAKQINTNE